eukprot:6419298-Alexandrium_andersonii.AAC.1
MRQICEQGEGLAKPGRHRTTTQHNKNLVNPVGHQPTGPKPQIDQSFGLRPGRSELTLPRIHRGPGS